MTLGKGKKRGGGEEESRRGGENEVCDSFLFEKLTWFHSPWQFQEVRLVKT